MTYSRRKITQKLLSTLFLFLGQERYGNMTRVYYREAVGALVVFDMTRSSTFQAVLKWKKDLDSKIALGNGRPLPAVLLANKCEQQSYGLCSKLPKLDNFSRDHGFVGWYETSAKVRIADHHLLPSSWAVIQLLEHTFVKAFKLCPSFLFFTGQHKY